MNPATVISALLVIFFLGCGSEPSLQKYFVEKSEKPEFVCLDISSDIINVDKANLSSEQKTALESFDKVNILAFKADRNNQKVYDEESSKITSILKDKKYQNLISIGSGRDGASVSFVGDEDDIDEFVVFAKKKEYGFTVIRILGNDMNPNNILNILSVIKKADVNAEQLKPLQALMQ